jgi:hypothetical protein
MYSKLRNTEFGIIDLLKSGWKIFQKNFLAILIITLLVDFPLRLLIIALSAATRDSMPNTLNLLSIIVSIWTSIAVMMIVEKEILGSRIQATAALKKAVPRWSSAFTTGFLFVISLLIRFLLIIPGFIYIVNCAFFLHAVSLRNQGWKAALEYSRNLVEGSFWKVFYIFFVMQLIIIIFPTFIFVFLTAYILYTSNLAVQGDTLPIYANVIVALFSSIAGYLYVVTGTVFFLNMDYNYNETPEKRVF